MRLAESAGRRVIDRSTAEQIGQLRRFLVDPVSARLVALHVDGPRGRELLLDWEQVVGFGPDAVVAASADSLRPPREQRERDFVKGQLDLEGKLVLTERGDRVGTLRDVEFDERSGQVAQLHVDDVSLPVRRFVAIGPYAVIVPA